MATPRNDSETNDLIRSAITGVPFGIMVVDRRGAVIMCNATALRHLGVEGDPEALVRATLLSRLPEFPPLQDALEEYRRHGTATFELVKAPHRSRFLTITGRPIPRGMIITTSDLTPEVEREIAAVNAMVEGQEMERRRLAKEIHDGIGPLLSTLKLCLEGMKAHVGNRNIPFNQNYHNALDLLANVTRDIRDISHDLMPSSLLDFGLVSALENLCRKANQSGKVQVNFYYSGIEGRLDQAIELGLYRMAQELLSNVFKYANALTANVQLIKHPESIILMVEDDGAGFDRRQLRQLAHNGIGLKNIRTRARSLGGSFTLESHPGEGVLATIEIPVP